MGTEGGIAKVATSGKGILAAHPMIVPLLGAAILAGGSYYLYKRFRKPKTAEVSDTATA